MSTLMPSITADQPFVHVVVAAIFNLHGQVLIARRPTHVHQGGLWEFPGGKVEPGESTLGALRRELFEELAIRVQCCEPLIQIRHRYPDKAVLLDVWKVTRYAGDPYGREGQPLAWISRQEFSRFKFVAANQPILKAIGLPDLYLITPEPGEDQVLFLSGLEDGLRAGIRLVQLRAPNYDADCYCELARAAIQRCHAHGTRLLINGEPEWAVELQADGVHLNSARLQVAAARPLGREYLVGASCHNAAEIVRANDVEADFAVVSPIKATLSHPDATPLGWRRFSELCVQAEMPAYALGGMCPGDQIKAKRCGGQGIAAIRKLWSMRGTGR
jgi:8-oxo-dGTP diphosphatase